MQRQARDGCEIGQAQRLGKTFFDCGTHPRDRPGLAAECRRFDAGMAGEQMRIGAVQPLLAGKGVALALEQAMRLGEEARALRMWTARA